VAVISFSEIDWTHWTPGQRAVLCFIFEPGRVLLIRKKRGLGGGKINAPGGKIEPGETPLEAAIRETGEEVGLLPHALRPVGDLSFQFTDGLALHCVVFRAEGCEGEPIETDEALPLWTALDAVPYHEMWADDVRWLPHVIAGKSFRARYLFNDGIMLGESLELFPGPELPPLL